MATHDTKRAFTTTRKGDVYALERAGDVEAAGSMASSGKG